MHMLVLVAMGMLLSMHVLMHLLVLVSMLMGMLVLMAMAMLLAMLVVMLFLVNMLVFVSLFVLVTMLVHMCALVAMFMFETMCVFLVILMFVSMLFLVVMLVFMSMFFLVILILIMLLTVLMPLSMLMLVRKSKLALMPMFMHMGAVTTIRHLHLSLLDSLDLLLELPKSLLLFFMLQIAPIQTVVHTGLGEFSKTFPNALSHTVHILSSFRHAKSITFKVFRRTEKRVLRYHSYNSGT